MGRLKNGAINRKRSTGQDINGGQSSAIMRTKINKTRIAAIEKTDTLDITGKDG